MTRRRRAVALAAALLVAASSSACTTSVPESAAVDVDLPEDFALAADFADPDVLEVDGGWLAYATQSEDAHVQVAESRDLESWTLLERDAFPDLPGWVREGDTWAPEVSAWAGRFLLFHSSTDDRSGVQCIGVAAATDPLGPFAEVTDRPLICPEDGAIDASFFVDDDGSPYLLWKEDSNCCGGTSRIWLSGLDGSGTALLGDPVLLLGTSRLWEGDVVEAPTLVRRADGYALLYSGGDYSTLDYGIGWARSPELRGPYVAAEDPLLDTDSSDFAYIGPGGQDVVGDTIVFHSWDASHSFRGLHVRPLTWEDASPVIALSREPD
ncbi:MAG: glycoside hydrolase family 43 protein [Naasia sp.]